MSLKKLNNSCCALVAMAILLADSSALATNFEWDGGAGDNLWDSFVGPESNWSPNSTPNPPDAIVLTDDSLEGPVTIDLNGPRFIQSIDAQGVLGTYTFINSGAGALTLLKSAGEAIITRQGSRLVIDNDLLLNSADTLRLNVQPDGGKITVSGDIASSAPSGTTILMPTVSNPGLPIGVELTGVISDGTAQTGLSVGFNGNTVHTGTVRITGANTYTGPTRVNIGTLEVDSIANIGGGPNALGQPASGDSTIRLGTLASGSSTATLRYLGSGHTSNRVIELAGKDNDKARIESSGAGALVLTGGVINPVNGETLFLAGDNTGDNTLGGSIQGGNGSDVTSLVKEGAGKWILTGESPTLDGAVTVGSGELVVTGSLGSPGLNTGRLQIDSQGTLSLEGGFLNVSDFNNFAGGEFNFRSGELRVASGTSAGGSGSFTVGTAGAGALHLAGGSGSFGDLKLQGVDDELAITGGSTYTFSSIDNSGGGALTFTGGAIVVNGGQLTTGAGSLGGAISGTGGLTKVGPGELRMEAGINNSYTGPTNINSGSLALIGSGDHLASGAVVNIAPGATFDLTQTTQGETIGGLRGGGEVLLGQGANLGLAFSTGTSNFSGDISGDGSITKIGLGTQRFSGNVAIDGPVGINTNGGTLEVAAGSFLSTSGITVSTATLAVIGGTIDTPGNIRPVSNNAVFNLTAGLVKANAIDRTVNSQYLHEFNWTGGTVHLLTATAINGSTGTAINRPFGPSLNLDDDMALIVDDTLSVTAAGALTIDGGSVTADNIVTGGNFNFNSGLLRLRSDQTLDATRLAGLDVDAPLTANRSLAIDGVATIEAPLVLAGGTFSVGAIVNPQNLILGSGMLEVTASDLNIDAGASLDATTGMTVKVTNGALNVAAGGKLNAIDATLDFRDGVNNSGDINLINTMLNGSLINGTQGSANLLGSNSIAGDLMLSDSSNLILDIAGDAAGEFDVLTILGNSTAMLDGSLNVSLSGGFSPSAGQQFTVLTAASVIDNGLTLGGSAAGRFNLLVTPSSVILEAAAGIAGDYNEDGVVDAIDYAVWREALGAPAGSLPNDVDGGVIGASQLATWRANYGVTTPAALSASVPEPSAALVLTLAMLASAATRRRANEVA